MFWQNCPFFGSLFLEYCPFLKCGSYAIPCNEHIYKAVQPATTCWPSHTAILLYCHTIILLYCHTAILLYCHTIILPYCHTAILPYYYTAGSWSCTSPTCWPSPPYSPLQRWILRGLTRDKRRSGSVLVPASSVLNIRTLGGFLEMFGFFVPFWLKHFNIGPTF